MLPEPLIQWIVTQVGLAGIAGLSLILLNRVWTDRVDTELARRAEEREDKLALLQAYQDNSAALKEVATTMQHHTATLERLCTIIDRPGSRL